MKSLFISSVLFVVCSVGAVVIPLEEDVNPVVHTPVGSIRGLRADDGNYSMYMGIPYAQVDPENLFGNAKPYPNFESTFDAFDDSSICPQEEEFNYTIVGSIDCLHINVYVPDSASDDNLLPVFVYIFGGGFSFGFPGRFLLGPRFLVRHDIILVTINYRLGPYGFMCLDIPEVPGNQGLKDQVMALRWIQNNIGAFGGDNSKVTIGGNSAGGMSVEYHLQFGQEENLYNKIILQSGVFLLISELRYPSSDAPLELAKFLNNNSTDVRDALTFLATVDPHHLIAATLESGISFGPCLENEYQGVQRLVTGHPVNIKKVPRVKDVDVLIGLTNDELYVGFEEIPDTIFQLMDFVQFSININFDFDGEDELYAEMHRIVTNFYFGDEDISADLKEEVGHLMADFFFNHPIFRTVKKYLDNAVQTMYLYMFSYSGARNFSKNRLNVTGGGAMHADELGYLFDISYMDTLLEPEDLLIVDRMTELWANFVKYGNPTPTTTELVPVIWQPVTADKWHFLELDTEIRVSTKPFHARTAFLDLFFKQNEKYQRGYVNDQEEDDSTDSGQKLILDLCLPALLLVHVVLRLSERYFTN